MVYLCSEPYAPTREHGVHALDPELSIDWPSPGDVVMSPRDATAPSLRALQEAGRLPSMEACQLLYGRRR